MLMIDAEQCQSMIEVRAGVDAIDDEVVRLLGARFRFMEAAARIKPNREDVRDEARKATVLDRAQRAAQAAGVPQELILQLYDLLIEGSIAYELEAFDAR